MGFELEEQQTDERAPIRVGQQLPWSVWCGRRLSDHLDAEPRIDERVDDVLQGPVPLWLGKKYDANRLSVDWLGRLLSVAGIAFLIEIAALIIDLVRR